VAPKEPRIVDKNEDNRAIYEVKLFAAMFQSQLRPQEHGTGQ
jgi:hypothetical protein